jgi:hypothetical protein
MIVKEITVIKSVIKANVTGECRQEAVFRQVSSKSQENPNLTNNAGDIFLLTLLPLLMTVQEIGLPSTFLRQLEG